MRSVFSGRRLGRATALVLATVLTVGVLCLVVAGGPPGTEPEPVAPPADAAVHEAYTAARLRLAELRVEKAEELNRQIPGLVTQTDMRRLSNRVTLLREQLAAMRRQPHGSAVEMQQAAARVSARIAAEDLATVRAVRARNPATISGNELGQFEAKAEIARLRVEILADPSVRRSPTTIMQMQIDHLTDFMVDAADALDATAPFKRTR